jgi:hypothetical protein
VTLATVTAGMPRDYTAKSSHKALRGFLIDELLMDSCLAAYGHRNENSVLVTMAISSVLSYEF